MAILGMVVLVLLMFAIAGLSKKHEEETGVYGPSRKAMSNIRRNARKKGISEQQAYSEWLRREQRKKR